ncbi:hypothetical protein F5148DRAFT_478887 [Russula earlei]|uniref:Uncharacterized protein n=1 Tax=Russula earlei TaxID=71964 RepID=A0ACC0TY79_9AGAM|nr:hypothetical protein F5148DRAFT_478887 [Russula earlei]
MASSLQSQALTRTYRPSPPVLSKTTRQMVPPFVQKLYELVNAPSTDELIRWSDTGDSFFVFEHERFANDVLPRFFKHRNFSSFVRQLNMYGFHKIPHLQQGVLKSDNETEFWNFEHPNFHRGQPDLLCLVTRKNSKGGSQQNADLADGDVPSQGSTQLLDVNSIVSGITAIKRHQQAISAELNELKTSNQQLWQEALASRERYKSQQDTINRILKFLASVFGRTTSHDAKDVDGHGTATPLVRRSQRLLIGNGPESNKHKSVEVVEVEDDDNKSVTEALLTDEQPGTPLPFAHIDASSTVSSVTSSPLFGPSTPTPPSGTYFHDRAFGTSVIPTLTSALSDPTITTPTPTHSTANNHSALELHRPQPAHTISPPSSSPTQDQIMQAAFQQLIQSPGQVQRIMQLLSSSSSHGSTPIPTPITGPAQSGSWTPPTSLDLPQLAQLALYDNGIGGSYNNVLTFDNKDTIGSDTMHLTEDEAHLARTYRDASEIDADVDVLQANINALIEDMGLDGVALATPSAISTDPPLPSSAGMPAEQTAADFDFEAFLTAFANAQDNESGATNASVVTDDRASASRLASGSDSASGMGTDRPSLLSEQPVLVGRKRPSDVAGLTLPLSEPSRTKSPLLPMGKADNTAYDPPRVKRNKK